MSAVEGAGEGIESSRQPDWRQEHPEAAAEGRRRYREAHAEEIAASLRSWRERNLDRSRQLNRESAHRQAKRRQQRMMKNAHQREKRAENPDAAREKSRKFREEHPDKVREYQRRYKDRHPERARQSSRDAAQRHRDANADAIRERQREAAAERRKRKPNQHKEWYEKNLEEQRARGREDQRRRRRLKALGLPPNRSHRTYAEERRAHDAAADEYFARRRSVGERGVIAAEVVADSELEIPKGVAKHRRVVLRTQLMPHNSDSRQWPARNSEEELPAVLVQWRRARDLQVLKESHEALVKKIHADRPQIFEHHRERNEARLREEIRLDSIARKLRGAPPYEIEQEVDTRLNEEVERIIAQRLRAIRHRTLRRAERIVGGPDEVQGTAAPYQAPGAGSDMRGGLR